MNKNFLVSMLSIMFIGFNIEASETYRRSLKNEINSKKRAVFTIPSTDDNELSYQEIQDRSEKIRTDKVVLLSSESFNHMKIVAAATRKSDTNLPVCVHEKKSPKSVSFSPFSPVFFETSILETPVDSPVSFVKNTLSNSTYSERPVPKYLAYIGEVDKNIHSDNDEWRGIAENRRKVFKVRPL